MIEIFNPLIKLILLVRLVVVVLVRVPHVQQLTDMDRSVTITMKKKKKWVFYCYVTFYVLHSIMTVPNASDVSITHPIMCPHSK